MAVVPTGWNEQIPASAEVPTHRTEPVNACFSYDYKNKIRKPKNAKSFRFTHSGPVLTDGNEPFL